MAGCCPTDLPGVAAQYSPKGETVALSDDLSAYVSGNKQSERCIVVLFDIFGVSPQAQQVCDQLAACGFSVVMPDVFRGKPWALADMPPKDRAAFQAFLGANTYEARTKADLVASCKHMQALGAREFGILGFCWGGGVAMTAAGEAGEGGQGGWFKAAATAHPSFLTPEGASKLRCPMLFLPSKDDGKTMAGVMERCPEGSEVKEYPTMHHGFCCARGDWSKKDQAEAASDAVRRIAAFFGKFVC